VQGSPRNLGGLVFSIAGDAARAPRKKWSGSSGSASGPGGAKGGASGGAAGVDGVTAAHYEADLEANLSDLLERFKSGRYWAPAVRRVHLAKPGTGKTRPTGVPTLEDKVLQWAVLMVGADGVGAGVRAGVHGVLVRTRPGGWTFAARTSARVEEHSAGAASRCWGSPTIGDAPGRGDGW